MAFDREVASVSPSHQFHALLPLQEILGPFFGCVNGDADLLADEIFRLGDELVQVGTVHIADDHEIDDGAVDPRGQRAGEVHGLERAQAAQHHFVEAVESGMAHQHLADGLEQGMMLVHPVVALVLHLLAAEHAGLAELVELLAHRVGANIKFVGESAQILLVARVQEELHEQPETNFAGEYDGGLRNEDTASPMQVPIVGNAMQVLELE